MFEGEISLIGHVRHSLAETFESGLKYISHFSGTVRMDIDGGTGFNNVDHGMIAPVAEIRRGI